MKNNFSENNTLQQLKDKIDTLTETVSMLKGSEQLLAKAINDAPIGMVTLTVDGRFMTVNMAFCQITGYSEKELLTMNISNITHPNDLDIGYNVIEELTAGKAQKANFEKRYIHRNGNTIHAQVSTILLKDEIGAPHIFFTQVVDITKGKRAEKKLMQNEKILQQIFDTSPDSIFLKDRNGMYLMVNKRMAELHSKKPEDLVGKYDYEIAKKWFETIDYNEFRKAEQDVVDNKKKLIIIKEPFVYQDGTKRWFRTTKIPFELEDNQRCLLVISTDITDRIQAEEDLISLSKFPSENPNAVLRVDFNGILLYINQAAVAIFSNWKLQLGLTVPIELLELIDNSKGNSVRKSNIIYEKRIFSITAAILQDSGYINFYAEDITERLLAEKEIENKTLELEKQFKNSEKQRIATLATLSDLNEIAKKLQSEIKERKNSENELAAVNKNLVMMDQTISSMNECVSITDKEHKIIFVNEAWEKTYGYKKEEAIGKTAKIIETEEKSDLKNEMRQQTKLGGWKGELTNKKKDGTIFPTELSITPLRDTKRNIIAQIGISTDITERKQAENKIKQSEESFRGLFNSITDAIYIQDKEGRFVDVNDGAIRMYGYPREFFIGKTPEPLSAPGKNDLNKVVEYIDLAFKGVPQQFEFWGIRSNGEVFPKIVRLQKGKYFEQDVVIALGTDITERKKTEKEIKDNEDKLKLAQSVAKLGHYSFNVKTGNWTSSIELNNIFGINKKFKRDLNGWLQIIHPDFQEEMSNYFQSNILQQQQNFNKEYKIVSIKAKQEKWVHGLGTLKFDENNNLVEIFGTIHDITDRKRTEEALIDSEMKYRKFFMGDLTGDFLSTREGKIIDCNPQFLNIYGFKSLKQAQDYNISKLYKSNAERERFIKKLEKNQILLDEQLEQYTVNGEKIIIQENVSGEFDDDGKLINIRGYVFDITERVKAKQEVVKLSTALEQSPVSIIITDTEGIIEYVNPTFEKLTGYSFDEVIGSKPSILKSGVVPDSEYSKLWRTITAGKVWIGEFLNKKKNGELYWESATISPILDNNNNITHFLAVKEDITKKKEIVGELMEREEKYRTLTQNLNVGVYRSTPGKNGRFIEVNPTFLKIFGFRSKNELERYKTVDFYSNPLERDRIENKLAAKGFLINEEAQLRKKDGSIFFASISSTSAKDELGNVIHNDGIVEDITERKEMMERILKERDRSQLYLDIAGVMFLALDRKGDIILANQKTCEIIGTTEKNLIGKNWFDNYLPKEIQLNTKDVFNILMNGNAKLGEFHENDILTASGEKRLIAWQNRTINDETGKILGIISSGLDITESKEDEKLRKQLYETSRNLAESLDIDIVLHRMSKQARALLKCSGVTVYMIEDDKKTLKPVVAYDPPYTKQVLATKIDIDKSYTGQAIKAKKGKIFNYHNNIKGAFHIKGTPKTDTDNIIVSPLEIDGEIIGALTLVRSKTPFTDKDLSIVNTFAVYGSTAIKNANSHKQILHEIEERKQAQALLKESHDRYESIFNGATDGIIYTSLDGNIISANSSIAELFSIKRKDLVGKNAIELAKSETSGATLKRFLEFINRILKGEEIRDYSIKTNGRELEFSSKKGKGKPDITIMVRDVTERNKARENVTLHQKNLQSLSNELAMAEEKARRRLAITLHDKLGQSLVLANLKNNELNKIVVKSEQKKIISEISGFLEDAINESRNITYELSPPVLYEMGLIPAINWKLDEIEKNNKIKTSSINRSKSYEVGKREQIILYRSINELLQNVLKHSKAKDVNITFRLLTNDYRITVSDNGIGFDLKTMRDKALSEKKFGLFSIMERIKYIGGSVEIDTKPRKGTKVVINMPIKKYKI